MATYRATTGNDRWTVPEFGDPSGTLIDGLAGTDTLAFDRLSRSRFSIKQDASTGYILIDSISGASSTFHLKLVNVERLTFSNGQDVVDLTKMFGDTTAPQLLSTNPVSGSSDVAVSANLVATFSETIAAGNGAITLLDANGGIVETFAAGTMRVAISGTTLTIDPTAALGYGKTYKLQIDAGAIKDTAGNSFAGTSNISFTTQVNTAPVAQAATFTLQEDTVLSATVPVATDAQGQAITYQLVQAAAHGNVTVNVDGSFRYTPLADFAGTDLFSYSASDGELASATTAVNLSITAVTDRFTGTAGADALKGTDGADEFVGNGGNDTIDGGSGVDTAIHALARSSYQVARTAQGWQVSSSNEGVDTLTAVERLQFSDVSLALDLDGNAARVAKVIGAVFGKAALGNAKYVGIGLGLLDKGVSYEQLIGLAVNVAFGSKPTSAQVVDAVYKNIFDAAPTDTVLASYASLLDKGVLTTVALVQTAADSSYNTAHIDLVGLAQQGIPYIPSA
jgi:hypothetical protein